MTDSATLKHILRFHSMDAVLVHPIDPSKIMNVPLLETNDVACDMLGYTREELLSLKLNDIDTSPIFDETVIEEFIINGFARFERVFLSKDGQQIPVEINVHALEVDGQTVGITVARDISGRKRDEKERALNELRFKALHHLSEMIDEPEQDILNFALEEGGRVTNSPIGYIYFVNDDETELILHAWSSGAMKECKVAEHQTVYKVEETGLWGEAVRQRKPIITNDYPDLPNKRGQPKGHIPIKRHMNLPVIEDGRIVIVAGVGNKEEEYTYADVVQLSLIMQGMWRIIQRKRIEKDLIQARRSAEKANEVKSQFLANMSHELRTPLNGIMGMTQILLSTDMSADQQEYLNLSLDATRHLTRVLTDLLALSSIESGGIDLASANFNLPETMEALFKPLALQASDKELTLTMTIDPAVPAEVCGDAGKIRQVMINLLFNAIKFTDAGNITLDVTLLNEANKEDETTCHVCFSVTDTGIGIPLEQQDSIFESFTLGEDYMTKQYGGTGLGLSISRQLADIMGGTVNVNSTQGKGSTFTFTVPLAIPSAGENQCVESPDSTPILTDPLNILLAEDEQVNSIMASRLLRKAGHSVTIVGNGQQAIEALTQANYDLILMDVQMPVVNGLEATKIIRKGAVEGAPKDIPIIGLTAFARSSEKQRFIKAGMERIVTKPYEADELMWTIAKVMSDKK